MAKEELPETVIITPLEFAASTILGAKHLAQENRRNIPVAIRTLDEGLERLKYVTDMDQRSEVVRVRTGILDMRRKLVDLYPFRLTEGKVL